MEKSQDAEPRKEYYIDENGFLVPHVLWEQAHEVGKVPSVFWHEGPSTDGWPRCPICNVRIKNKTRLEKHIAKVHPNVEHPARINQDEQKPASEQITSEPGPQSSSPGSISAKPLVNREVKMDEHSDNVEAALVMLLDEIEDVLGFIQQEILVVTPKGNYESVGQLAKQAQQVQTFQTEIQNLKEEWDNIFPDEAALRSQHSNVGKRLPRGLRTREDAFYIPILRVLMTMAGKGQVADVLSQVGEQMKSALNEHDFAALLAPPHMPRWQKTASWARSLMVKKGYLSSESPRGIWEVTEAGKQYLATKGCAENAP